MKRLRLQFALFFILLSGSLGFLVWNSYRQLAREERELWRAQAEKVYNQMQAAVSDFLTAEDARRWTDYSAAQTSKPPQEDAHGMIGYFQIDPDDVFSTPYLPSESAVKTLEQVTLSLRGSKEQKEKASAAQGYVELGEIGKLAKEDVVSGLDLLREEAKPPESVRSKNVYPNPVQEQAFQLEMRKGASAKSAPAKKLAFAGKAADDNLPAAEADRPWKDTEAAPAAVSGGAPAGPAKPEGEVNRQAVASSVSPAPETPPMAQRAESQALPPKKPQVLSDPFQARLVDQNYLVFYRKIWVDHRQFLQGFAVDLEKFYSWLMDQSFANSELPEFALARLELSQKPLAQYGIIQLSLDGLSPLFRRDLGYPLNLFDWSVYAARLPRIGTRWFLNALSLAVGLLATIGLFLIYRSAAAQVMFSQKRQDFVSAVTHELKTPLTSIRMYSEMLEDDWAKDEAKRKEYYRQISKESGRLSRLIDNVLQLARLEKRTYKLNPKKENPAADFAEIASELRRIAERQGFVLETSSPPDLPPITYDPEAVKQILLTLLDNSVKFAAESADKTLALSLERQGGDVVWSWRDRGPGVPSGDLKRIFENFYRVENEMTRKTQGTGIGLAMSRMLAESMGAAIEARNRDGGGLEVRLAFTFS